MGSGHSQEHTATTRSDCTLAETEVIYISVGNSRRRKLEGP